MGSVNKSEQRTEVNTEIEAQCLIASKFIMNKDINNCKQEATIIAQQQEKIKQNHCHTNNNKSEKATNSKESNHNRKKILNGKPKNSTPFPLSFYCSCV